MTQCSVGSCGLYAIAGTPYCALHMELYSTTLGFGHDGPYEIKDSGEKATYSTGMQRDTAKDKLRYDLCYQPMLKRWAQVMTTGAKKYGAKNWRKASTQEELDRFKESAYRHFMEWFNADNPTEDTAAQIFFNISGAEYVKQRTPGLQWSDE